MNEIILGDCIKVMAGMADKSFDLCYADPPFNARKGIGKNSREYANGLETKTDEEYKKFCLDWFAQARRVAKKLVVTPGVRALWNYPPALWVVEINKPSSVSYSAVGGFNCYEPFVFYDGPIKGKRIPRDVVVFDAQNFIKDGRHSHPCPDNGNMCLWIIDLFLHRGGAVLVPFSGSGQMEIAAQKMGCNYLGIDIVPEYVELARHRLRMDKEQKRI